MKIFTFDTESVKPVTIKHSSDKNLLYKGATENYNFGLRLQTYNLFEDIGDRQTNYNTAYYLSNLQSLSSIMSLKTPYTLQSDSKFTTYIKSGNYSAEFPEGMPVGIGSSSAGTAVGASTAFNTLSSRYFFTFNISTNEALYITKELSGETYYGWCSGGTDVNQRYIYFSKTIPTDLTSHGAPALSAHLFRYVLNDTKIQLYPYQVAGGNYPNSVTVPHIVIHSGNYFHALPLSSLDFYKTYLGVNETFDIKRNAITKNKGTLNNTFSYYLSSYNKDSVGLNLNTTTKTVSNNYLAFSSNYTLKYNDEWQVSIDTMPLKNQATLEEFYSNNNHYNSQPSNLNRQYEKLFTGNIQNQGYDKIYLSYNIGTKDIHFPPSKLTYFTTPSSLSPYTILNINDSKIDNLGAIAGNNPLISDKVFKRRSDFKNNNFTDDINATYLCSWLSGNTKGEKLWVDRYYNPDAKDFNTALSTISGTAFTNTVTAAGTQSTYVFDLSSSLTFEKNNDYAYYHIGEVDYANHIKSLSSFDISKDLEILTKKGSAGSFSKVKDDVEINFDGNRFGRFKTDHNGDLSMSFWLSAQDFTLPLGYKLLGNYFEEGFGIFNTDFVTPNIFLPQGNKILLLNNDLEIYDEVEVLENNEPVKIKGIARKDNFSEFYVLGENNVIYIYNSNPNLISKVVDLSGYSSLVIDDIDITKDRFYAAFNPAGKKGYFYYDSTNNSTHLKRTVSADSFGDKYKLYVGPDKNNKELNNIHFLKADSNIDTGNEIAIDSNKSTYTIRQQQPDQRSVLYNLLYKNHYLSNDKNAIKVSGGSTESFISNVIVDDDDFIITIHDGIRISKFKNNRELVEFKDLTFLDKDSKKYIDIILDFEGKNYVKYYLIVETFSDKTILHKVDKNFNLSKTRSLGSRVINNLNLTKTITSYYFLKKYNACKNTFKIVLKAKPKFTKTGGFKKTEAHIEYDITKLNAGYNHFAINVSIKQGWMDLYVNGYKYARETFSPGTFLLDNPLGTGIFIGALSTPYYLNFSSRLLQLGKYLLRDLKLKGFKMYNRVLDYYEIRSHYNYHSFDRDTVWSLPIGQRTYIDTIDQVYKFGLPEKNSNTYDVDIQNLGITDTALQQKIKDEIKKELPKVTPYYDTIRNVNLGPVETTDNDITFTPPTVGVGTSTQTCCTCN